jgi:ornithine carbamoyltransferase
VDQRAYRFGFELDIACPEGYEPADHLLSRAQKVAKVRVVRDPMEAAEGAQVVNTDVWASMGQEQEQKAARACVSPDRRQPGAHEARGPNAIFLHCLPAHRGEEVSAEVIDGPAEPRVGRSRESPSYSEGDHGYPHGRGLTVTGSVQEG